MKSAIWIALLLLTLTGCGDDDAEAVKQAAAAPVNVTPREGVGVAIVVDVSGSMGDKVKDSDGKMARKDAIARRAVGELYQRAEGFCQRNPERIVEVGLYKFEGEVTQVIGFGRPSAQAAQRPIQSLQAGGDTAIGRAVLQAKRDLDATGLTAKHIVVVTDGENTEGPSPQEVATAMAPSPTRPAVYMIAFDINSDVFRAVKGAGWLLYSADNATELQNALDVIFGENILLER